MRIYWRNSTQRWKDSFVVSISFLTALQTFCDVIDINLFPSNSGWLLRLCVILGFLIVSIVTVFCAKQLIARRGIKLTVHDNNVRFVEADIFQQTTWRLIPFNENYDTKVDDVVIARSSLNGIFIDNHVSDLKSLRRTICSERKELNSPAKFPLGHIIRYKNQYMLLAFTHFEDNKAILSHSDFEKCLIKMWKEIERTYAGRPVSIPLLGSGITRFTDTPHKDLLTLAKCLICTLKMSGVHIKQPITVCLTREAMDVINIYELKSKK